MSNVWPKDVVSHLRDHWMRLPCHRSLFVNAEKPNVTNEFVNYCVDRFRQYIFGVFEFEIRPEDCVIKKEEDFTQQLVTVEVRWAPKTKTIELFGGHADGYRVEIPKVGMPYKIAVRQSLNVSKEASSGDGPLFSRFTYEYSGWDSMNHNWTYTFKE